MSAPGLSARELALRIDHSLLRPDATDAEIDRLCDEAVEHGFFSVCVNGKHVERCAARLGGGSPVVCAVVGFPLGACGMEAKLNEASGALHAGAREIDLVLDIGGLKSREYPAVQLEVRVLADRCHRSHALLKVILETCLLDEDEKRRAGRLALAGGADFLKTSTGFSTGGATIEDVRLLRELAGPGRGVKAAGGIGEAAFAQDLLRAGASRLGMSRSVDVLRSLGA